MSSWGGGPARPQGAPLPLTSPPRCAAPCQLASLSGPRAPRGAGGAGPPGWRGWGTPDKQAPSLRAGAGARGGARFAPDAWGVAGWQRGRGGLCARLGPTRAWVAAAPAAEGGGGGATGWEPWAGRRRSRGLSLPRRRRNLGAGFGVTPRVRWAPGSLKETANLPARDYIKESPPPAAPEASGVGVGEGRAGRLFSRLPELPHPTAGGWAGQGPGPGRPGPAGRSPKGLRGSGGAEVGSGEALAQPTFSPLSISPTSSPAVGEVWRGTGEEGTAGRTA